MSNIYPIHVISDPMLPLNVSQGTDAGGVFFFIVFLVGLHKLFKNSQARRKKSQ